ncbi:hypothetical protein R1sor_006701 [Riccia sorocarpa]|uniref:Uncharacterized protein n=1 Tax=Riccia sorocarpa TaxID=122646 RepID=A0ABD3HSJ3_9MARC
MQQTIKFVRGSLKFGSELDSPGLTSPTTIPNTPKTATPAGRSSSFPEAGPSGTANAVSPTYVATRVAGSQGTTVDPSIEDLQDLVLQPEVEGLPDDLLNRDHCNTAKQSTRPAVVTISSDSQSASLSSDVEIIGTATRRRPPTRSSPMNQNQHIRHTTDPSQYGYNRHGVGVVTPTFIGKSVYMAVERDYRFWFCPNGKCHRGPGAPQCKSQMPPVSTVIPLQIETGLTQDEVDFLTVNGFDLVRRPHFGMSNALHSEAEIKVLVDA